MRLILVGELIEYTEMMGQAREVATEWMIARAEELGADAVINVRFVTNQCNRQCR
ncbi:MAG: heavy metal-binding domain-containing protein [Dehalococcoidales bacterium]